MKKTKLKTILTSRSGQTIVEAIVAVSFLTVGYMGILALLNQSLAAASLVSEQNIATYLAAEGIEIVKNLSDANTLQGNAYSDNFQVGSYEVHYTDVLNGQNPGTRIGNQNVLSSNPLLFDETLGYNYAVGNPTKFFRTIRIMPPAPPSDSMHVISLVTWQAKGGSQSSVTLEDFLFTD